MMTLLLLSILIGAVLGLRLKVTILIPAIVLAVVGLACIGAARGDAFSSIALVMVLAAISLELGYLGGSASRFVMSPERLRTHGRTETSTPRAR